VQAIDAHQVRVLNATDDMIMGMFDASSSAIALPSVRYCGFASFSAKPDVLMRRADERQLNLVGLYGMSEVQAFFARQPLDAPTEERQLGGGFPIGPLGKVRVRDPESGKLLGLGESGEIELRGPSLMKEYFMNPEATTETFTSDGFIRSGDLGYTTEGGGFVYLARMGDTLRLGGFLVSPLEIETFLNDHPMVSGSQVVGVTTDNGPRPVCFVTVPADAVFDEAALVQYCTGGLAKYKVPTRIIPISEFPTTKSANGTKIQKARLREMAQEAVS
jgi:fatty-acyl-CoA synthase